MIFFYHVIKRKENKQIEETTINLKEKRENKHIPISCRKNCQLPSLICIFAKKEASFLQIGKISTIRGSFE